MTRGIALLLVASVCTGVVAAQAVVDPSESPRWQVAARGRGLPAVAGDRVFALTSDHQVLALALDDGRELWRRSTGERSATTDGMRVVVAGDLVIAGDWDVYAYDAATGASRWTFHPADGYAPGISLGAAAGSRVFTGSPSGRLYAIDAGTGRQLWSAVVERVADDGPLTTVFAPVVSGGLVVAGYTVFAAPDTGGVVAVDADSGVERWRFRFPVPDAQARDVHLGGGPVIAGDVAIASSGDGRVWAIDLATGALKWSVPALAGPADGIITTTERDLRGLSVAGGLLIVGSLTGYLTAFDVATHQQVWQLRQGWLGSLSWRDFTHADGVIYVPFLSGFLHAIDAATGVVLWKTVDYRRGFSWPVAVAGDRVIVAASSGVWAMNAARRPAGGGDRR